MIRKIHTYAGLLTLVNLMAYGVAGLVATAGRDVPASTVVFERPFIIETGASDMRVAQLVVADLGLTLATPVHSFVIQHDAAGRLWLDLRDVNGRRKVAFLDGKIRVEEERTGLGRFLTTLHSTTGVFQSDDIRLQVWAYYNEFAMWSLLLMVFSGIWLWWKAMGRRGSQAVRTIHRRTATIVFPFVLLYGLSAVQLAHRSWMGGMLKWLTPMHRMAGVWHPGAMSNVWGVIVGCVSLGLFTLGGTGVMLWFGRSRERLVGGVLLVFGVVLCVALIASMRLG